MHITQRRLALTLGAVGNHGTNLNKEPAQQREITASELRPSPHQLCDEVNVGTIAPADERNSKVAVTARHVVTTCALMLGLFALVYNSYAEGSVPARMLRSHLEAIAWSSGGVLRWLGEEVEIHGTTVSGRFAYAVVLDCAALDAQALFVAAVLAFPAAWWTRLVGVATGLLLIFAANVARLVGLYFAGAHSRRLFQVLHEEVLVFVIVACVCLLFLSWANWARSPLRLGAKEH